MDIASVIRFSLATALITDLVYKTFKLKIKHSELSVKVSRTKRFSSGDDNDCSLYIFIEKLLGKAITVFHRERYLLFAMAI